jgi:hypothetical protein
LSSNSARSRGKKESLRTFSCSVIFFLVALTTRSTYKFSEELTNKRVELDKALADLKAEEKKAIRHGDACREDVYFVKEVEANSEDEAMEKLH